MQRFKWDGYKKIEETVSELLGGSDPVLLHFDVMPLDSVVKDISSPKVFVSKLRIVFVIDGVMEVYNLREIAVWVIGDKPNFTFTLQALEPRLDYTSANTPLSKNTDMPDGFLRFAIMEKNFPQREFVLRKDTLPAKAYQTWAFAQFVRNLQRGEEDFRLIKMVSGNFSLFDGMFLVGAFLIFLVYVLLSVLLGGILPDFVLTVLDYIFGIVCIGVLGWMFWTIFVNIRRYRKIYEEYKIKSQKKVSNTQNI